jgi:myo-inositol-1(or 4)-monophosphatase
MKSNELNFVENLAREAGRITLRYFRRPVESKIKEGNKGLVSVADLETEKFIINQIKTKFPSHEILAEESSPELLKTMEDADLWMIDPIDGTTNFLQGNVYYCVSIALYKVDSGNSHPVIAAVHQPFTGDMYLAEKRKGAFLNDKTISLNNSAVPKRGCYGTGFAYNSEVNLHKILDAIAATRRLDPSSTIRVNGAAALDICRTAEGILDGFWEFDLSPWDMAAGSLIMKEAGGVVTNFKGEDFDPVRDRNIICGTKTTHRVLLDLIQPIFT